MKVTAKYVGEKVAKVRWCTAANPQKSRTLAVGGWDGKTNHLQLWTLTAGNAPNSVFEEQPSIFNDIAKTASIPLPAGVSDMTYSSNRMLVGLTNGDVQIYQHDTNGERFNLVKNWDAFHAFRQTGTRCCCNGVAFHPDSIEAATCGEDGRIHVVNIAEDIPSHSFNADGTGAAVNAITYQTSSQILSVNTSAQLQMWDTRAHHTDSMRSEAIAGDDSIQVLHSVAVHPDQPNIVATGGSDGVLSLWDMRQVKFPIGLTQAHTSDVWEIKFHPMHPDHLFTCSEDGTLLHWDCNPMKLHSRGTFSISSDRSNLNITNLIGNTEMGINSVDVDVDVVACGTDNSAVALVEGLHF